MLPRKLNLTTILLLGLCCSCKIIPHQTKGETTLNKPNDLLVFFDGTSNTPESNTNVYKLYSNTETKENLSAFYAVGVGSRTGGIDVSGMFVGAGIAYHVKDAYLYLCNTYTPKDRIHVFGFSRGAYTSRILANFIHVVGLLDLNNIPTDDLKKKLITKLYRAYVGNMSLTERRRLVNKCLYKFSKKHNVTINRLPEFQIETLNLFDTVAALSAPNYKERFCFPNKKHLEQFVNIKKVNHALALDDNRAQIFTPVLASCNCIELDSDRTLDDVVNEVWFAGAHSDVGGGYSDNDDLSHITLHWMKTVLEKHDLFPISELNREDLFASDHDAESRIEGVVYRRRNRDIAEYYNYNKNTYNTKRLKLHESVKLRLENNHIPHFKIDSNKLKRLKHRPFLKSKQKAAISHWFEREPFKKCFKRQEDNSYKFIKDSCKTIEIIPLNPK